MSATNRDVLDYLNSFEMFKTPAHRVTVELVQNNHGYPYRANCACGWVSRGYVAAHAAENMGSWHVAESIR